jgi:Fe-S oxidoreductase
MTAEDIVDYCYQCGKCTGKCPLWHVMKSPRVLIQEILSGDTEDVANSKDIWRCLTCNECTVPECPMAINFAEFIRTVRTNAVREGYLNFRETHHEIFKTATRMMANPDIKPNKLLNWPEDAKISKEGETALFVGCLEFFDNVSYFDDMGTNYGSISPDAVRILNELGEIPVVLEDEKCCGHDVLWSGDEETFLKLAEYNTAAFKKANVKRIITTCAECYRTLAVDYPNYVTDFDFEVKKIDEGQLEFPRHFNRVVTYHDPCRLGRHMGVYDAPRKVMENIPGLIFKEMKKSKEKALCCGVSAWLNCDDYAKAIRVDRLTDAQNTGAQILVNTCPKCEMHFNCLRCEKGEDKPLDFTKLEVMDFVTLVAKALGI